MKAQKIMSLDIEVIKELMKQKINTSRLVNDFLINHMNITKKPKIKDLYNQQGIIDEVSQVMAYETQQKKIEKFIKKSMNIKKYKKGIKEGKWRSKQEYAMSELNIVKSN